MKKTIFTLAFVLVQFLTFAQFTAIPDANFEQRLITLGIDSGVIDHKVLTSAISGVTDLSVNYENISSLEGIQGFTSLQHLWCEQNQLTSLNVSGLTNLDYLVCNSNQLQSINVVGTNLILLDCSNNNLSSLNLSGLTNLQNLNYSSNNISNLNLNGFINLQTLNCSLNNISNLNLSGLTNLENLNYSYNNLPNLNLSGLNLFSLNCNGNNISSLNISNMTNLQTLKFGLNSLTSINLSGLTNLQILDCSVNPLSSLNLSGLTALTQLYCSNNNLTSLNLSGLNYLDFLLCDYNNLSSLNLSGVPNLTQLNCSNNNLTSLNLSSLTQLLSLDCRWNELSSLNLSGLTALQFVSCDVNNLSSLNLSGLTTLYSMTCTNNTALTCITVSDPAAAAANANWTKDATANYSANCGVVIPTSKVRAAQCGSTLATLDANINADYVAGYQQYRFEVTNGATVNTVDVNKYNFSLTQTPGITYGTTYGVRVAVKMGGTWGTYGASCNVTTPTLASNTVLTTNVHPNFCGVTLAALDTKIPAKPVFNAQGYRFEITTGGVTTVYDSTFYIFILSQAGVVVDYGMTYTIRVAALVNGVYGDYGATCSVATPVLATSSVPTTQVHPNYCGATLAALDTKIPASPVSGATGYRFEITTGGVTTVYDSSTYNFKLSQAGVVVANGTTYAIRVAAKINGFYGNYGASCNIYTPGATAREFTVATEFAVAAYPNPFNSAFKLQVTASTDETIFVSVYDMMGKQIENREVAASEIENATIGQDYATGIYNVLVSQGVNTKTVRLVKN